MKLSILAIFGFVAALPAFAGPSISGGGKGVLCVDRHEKKNVELLDLWEARTIYGRNAREANGSVDQMVAENLRKIATAFSGVSIIPTDQNNPIDGVYAQLMDIAKQFLQPNRKVHRLHRSILKETQDSQEVATPSDCEVVQVVNYRIAGSISDIYINQDLYKLMDPVNQAALISHEALYAFLRMFYKEENSVRVRRAVGMAFAGLTFKDFDEVAPKKRIFCHAFFSDSVNFFMDRNELKAVPVVVNGQARIGYSAVQAMPLSPLDPKHWQNFFFEDGSCAGKPDTNFAQEADPLFLVTDPDSVDYDNTAAYLRTCHQGKVKLVVPPKSYNGSENVGVAGLPALNCSWTK